MDFHIERAIRKLHDLLKEKKEGTVCTVHVVMLKVHTLRVCEITVMLGILWECYSLRPVGLSVWVCLCECFSTR